MSNEEELDNVRRRERFLDFFQNTRFRYIHEYNRHKGVIQGSNVLDLSRDDKGQTLNDRDFGIYFSVNGFPPDGSATEDRLVSLNCNYVDLDVDSDLSHEKKDRIIQETIMSGVEVGAPPPTIVVRTKNGAHMYWLYPEPIKPTPDNLEVWREVEKGLVHVFKGDKAAVDPARVLRVPYTMHLKDPNDPYPVKVTSYKPEAMISLTQIQAMLPPQIAEEVRNEKIPAIDRLVNGVPIGEGQRHAALAQMAGLLLRGADTPEKVAVARKNFYDWDRKIVGSPERFEERKKELDNTFEGILKREMAGREVMPPLSSKAPPRVWSVGEILAHDFGDVEWVVESLIPKHGVTVISGNPGDFKTWLTIHTAISVARNTPVFGKFKTTQGGVLVIDEEDHLRLLKRRLELLGAANADNVHYLSQSGFKVDSDEARNALIGLVKEKNIKLVILDSLVRIHGQDENDAKGMAKVSHCILEIVGAGASVLFTHHHRKQLGYGPSNVGQSMRGSSDILASVDCHITVEKKRDEDRLVIRQSKLRQDEALKPFELSISKGADGPTGFEYVGEFDEKKMKVENAAEAVVAVLADGKRCRTDLIEILSEEDFGKSTVEAAIIDALDRGKIEKVPKEELPKEEQKKAYYRIPAVGAGVVEGPVVPETYPDDWGAEDVVAGDMTPDEWFESLP